MVRYGCAFTGPHAVKMMTGFGGDGREDETVPDWGKDPGREGFTGSP